MIKTQSALHPECALLFFGALLFYNYLNIDIPLDCLSIWRCAFCVSQHQGLLVFYVCWNLRLEAFLKGIFYILVLAAYLLFERYAVNYRPVLIGGFLEASYPSSTTLLVLCVMPTALLQLLSRIKHATLRTCISVGITAFAVFMVVGRLLSGVHWLIDIMGGILLAAGLVLLYETFADQ